jgi:hypothetical protein
MGRLAQDHEAGLITPHSEVLEHEYQFDYEGTRPPLVQPYLGLLQDLPKGIGGTAQSKASR